MLFKITPRYLFVLLAALLLLPGCASKPKSDERPVLAVSIEPLRYFVEQIAGGKFRVITLVPAGVSPETYEPTPDKLVELSRAKAYLRMGTLPFEQTWLKRLTETIPNLKITDAANSVEYISADEGCDYVGHGLDLHVWTSPKNALVIARNISQFLSTIDAENETYYQKRLEMLLSNISRLDLAIHRQLQQLTHRTFVIYHPALGYFAKDYGLVQLSIEDHGKEPSVAQMMTLINRCKQDSVQVIFKQKEFASANVKPLADETGATVIEINPLSYEWDKEMMRIAQALRHE